MNLKPKIQIALDLTEIDKAIQIADQAVKGGVEWIEVGTPLIKSQGTKSIKKISEKFPDKKIIADMKTIDTGSLEVKMASEAGADIVSILGESDEKTIREAIKESKKHDTEIIADLITIENPETVLKKLENLKVDYIGIHTGIDQQKEGKNPLNKLENIKNKKNTPIAVAGGLDTEEAAEAVQLGASILIIGSAITSAENPKKKSQEILNSIKEASE